MFYQAKLQDNREDFKETHNTQATTRQVLLDASAVANPNALEIYLYKNVIPSDRHSEIFTLEAKDGIYSITIPAVVLLLRDLSSGIFVTHRIHPHHPHDPHDTHNPHNIIFLMILRALISALLL